MQNGAKSGRKLEESRMCLCWMTLTGSDLMHNTWDAQKSLSVPNSCWDIIHDFQTLKDGGHESKRGRLCCWCIYLPFFRELLFSSVPSSQVHISSSWGLVSETIRCHRMQPDVQETSCRKSQAVFTIMLQYLHFLFPSLIYNQTFVSETGWNKTGWWSKDLQAYD